MVHLIVKCIKFKEYEVYTYIFKTLGNFITSQNEEIRKQTVGQGCLQEMLEAHDTSQYFRIRRICSEYLNYIGEYDP